MDNLTADTQFTFEGVYLMAFIPAGNYGGTISCSILELSPLNPASARLGMLSYFDAIAFFIDNCNERTLQCSKEELENVLTFTELWQPNAILVPVQTQNTSTSRSGCGNDPELIAEFGLEDAVERGKECVSVFGYSLSQTRFSGCLEGELCTLILCN